MQIINGANIFTNEQLQIYIQLLGEEYEPKTLIICENRKDLLKCFKYIFPNIIVGCSILAGQIEGIYRPPFDCIMVYVFSENDDGDNLQSQQLYSLHALTHELRHRYQVKNKMKISEQDADDFATKFVNGNSGQISKIMNWSDEWEVEEED